VLITALLHLLRQQQRWAWVPLPMVLVPGMAAPAELVGLVPEPQPGQQGDPVGGLGFFAARRAGGSRSDAVRWSLVSASLGIVVILLKLVLH
jgi:hypothetical protein